MSPVLAALTGTPAVDLVIQTAAIIAALAVTLKPVRGAAQTILRLRDEWDHIQDRLDALEQLRPNGGSSVYDDVKRLRANQDQIMADQVEIVRAVTQMSSWFEGQVEPPRVTSTDNDPSI